MLLTLLPKSGTIVTGRFEIGRAFLTSLHLGYKLSKYFLQCWEWFVVNTVTCKFISWVEKKASGALLFNQPLFKISIYTLLWLLENLTVKEFYYLYIYDISSEGHLDI